MWIPPPAPKDHVVVVKNPVCMKWKGSRGFASPSLSFLLPPGSEAGERRRRSLPYLGEICLPAFPGFRSAAALSLGTISEGEAARGNLSRSLNIYTLINIVRPVRARPRKGRGRPLDGFVQGTPALTPQEKPNSVSHTGGGGAGAAPIFC